MDALQGAGTIVAITLGCGTFAINLWKWTTSGAEKSGATQADWDNYKAKVDAHERDKISMVRFCALEDMATGTQKAVVALAGKQESQLAVDVIRAKTDDERQRRNEQEVAEVKRDLNDMRNREVNRQSR